MEYTGITANRVRLRCVKRASGNSATPSSVELPSAGPATAWSSRQRTPLQRGASRLLRGVPSTDPFPAWSSAASAWSSRQQTPLQRGAGRLQRGAGPGRPRYSVELGGLELAPADPATAWSWAASAWSWPRQTRYSVELQRGAAPAPLQRGAGRLQRGAGPGRSRYSVELGGSSVEPPADPATAWSWAAPAWS